ncbi:MAG: transcription elongation factor GreA [Gammaproteobacteria bacterium]
MTQTKMMLTKAGADRIRERLYRLERIERKKISESIASARAHGDLSENAEYHAAKEKQGLTEAHIRSLRAALTNSMLVDVNALTSGNLVEFGMTVTLLRLSDELKLTFQIVGELEADASEGRIAQSSPIAKAVLGKSLEDVVVVETPEGEIEYEILEIAVNPEG